MPRVVDAKGKELRVGDRVRNEFFEDDADVVGFGSTSLRGIDTVELFVDEHGPWDYFVGESGRCPDLTVIDHYEEGN